MVTRFNPSGAVSFDLSRGLVHCGGAQLLVPADALSDLCRSVNDETLVDFGRRLGTAFGRRIADRLGDSAASASVEDVLDHLGGELALAGLGSLGAERWGRALVLSVSGGGLSVDLLLGSVLEGALQRAFGRDCSAVHLQRSDSQIRFLITSARGASKVRGLLQSGVRWADALSQVQDAGGAA